jgi:excisionase family DNA binding protein
VTERVDGLELTLALTLDVVDAIADLVERRLRERDGGLASAEATDGPRWLYGAEKAAEYLDLPLGTAQKWTAANLLPHRKVGGRNLYRTDELDEALEAFYEGPARGLPWLGRVS